jgi:hypothetical protein
MGLFGVHVTTLPKFSTLLKAPIWKVLSIGGSSAFPLSNRPSSTPFPQEQQHWTRTQIMVTKVKQGKKNNFQAYDSLSNFNT